jgi:GBP family porin
MRYKKIRATQLAVIVGTCTVMLGATPSANAAGEQLATIYNLAGTGFGPQIWGVVAASSFVQLYGTVDMALNYTNAGGRAITRVQSGNAWTSKFGFYGQEYLGNAWTTFFRLESGFTANNGGLQDTTSLFNRAAYVGLNNPAYGTLTLGRTYSATGVASLAVDPFFANAHDAVYTYMGQVSDLGRGATADGLNRVNNLINYTTPRIAGNFSATLSYALKSDQDVGPAVRTRSASVTYNSATSMAGLAYGQTWCDPAVTGSCSPATGQTPAIRTDVIIANAQHDFGPLVGQVGFVQFVPHYAGDAIARVYTLGLQRYSGRTLYRIALNYRDTTIKQDYAYGTTLGADYYLSKRTSLYTRLAVLKNGPQSALTYNYDSTAGGALVGKGQTVTSATFGITHQF